MLKTYIRLAFRSLLKNKVFSFINIFGLSIGLTSCLLISMYVIREFSYDSYQNLGSRLFQLDAVSARDGKEYATGHTPAPMAPALQLEFPEIESTTRLIDAFQDDKTLLQYQSGKDIKSLYETKGFFADSTFFLKSNSSDDETSSGVFNVLYSRYYFVTKSGKNHLCDFYYYDSAEHKLLPNKGCDEPQMDIVFVN